MSLVSRFEPPSVEQVSKPACDSVVCYEAKKTPHSDECRGAGRMANFPNSTFCQTICFNEFGYLKRYRRVNKYIVMPFIDSVVSFIPTHLFVLAQTIFMLVSSSWPCSSFVFNLNAVWLFLCLHFLTFNFSFNIFYYYFFYQQSFIFEFLKTIVRETLWNNLLHSETGHIWFNKLKNVYWNITFNFVLVKN